jgi:hypothetical protein
MIKVRLVEIPALNTHSLRSVDLELHAALSGKTSILTGFYFTESQRPANKRRKRKGSQSGAGANSAPPAPNKKRSPGPNFALASQVCNIQNDAFTSKSHFLILYLI